MRVYGEQTLLDLHLYRLKKIKQADAFIVATTEEEQSSRIIDIAKKHDFSFYQGSLHDVLDRYYQAALLHGLDVIVRVTSDCPLVDPALVDKLILKFREGGYDYVSNVDPPSFIDGFDCEVFSMKTLRKCWEEAKDPALREHVTSYVIETDKFKRFNVAFARDLSKLRLTVDTQNDFDRIAKIVKEHGSDRDYQFYTSLVEHDNELH
jgi:spore coat polysaccharide biosynthesis protein SpsF (cytidylyltransferase family)